MQPGVADERCWMDGVAGGARSVEPVGGWGVAVRKKTQNISTDAPAIAEENSTK